MEDTKIIGKKIHDFARILWGFDRSITGDGVRKTLQKIKEVIPSLKIYEVPSGAAVYDWTVPMEWKVNAAYILTPGGKKICDFKKNNLHLVGYSKPIKCRMSLSELKKNLYSLENQPNAIPYVTSYYKEHWGFCISQNELDSLEDGEYQVVIDTELFDGHLSYGEYVLAGSSDKEIFFSTYICHPSMANNELSGPVVLTFLAKWLAANFNNHFTYRIIFIPETIGSIAYLSKNLDHLKSKVIAGFNISCIGDNRCYSYLPSKNGETISDSVAKHVLKHIYPNYKSYQWSDRGSDERQYCSPGVDLPIASLMRTKYGEYDEYHTSLDDLESVVTPDGLGGGYYMLQKVIKAIEMNIFPKVTVLCEPQLGRRGLYPNLSIKDGNQNISLMMDVISWSDGKKSLLEISELCGEPVWEVYSIVEILLNHKLIHLSYEPH